MDALIFDLAFIGLVGCTLILAVLYDEWRHPANAYTGWLARNR